MLILKKSISIFINLFVCYSELMNKFKLVNLILVKKRAKKKNITYEPEITNSNVEDDSEEPEPQTST